ncbi:hypothetical protein CBL_00682 [Carabus blaptoides fortunei]
MRHPLASGQYDWGSSIAFSRISVVSLSLTLTLTHTVEVLGDRHKCGRSCVCGACTRRQWRRSGADGGITNTESNRVNSKKFPDSGRILAEFAWLLDRNQKLSSRSGVNSPVECPTGAACVQNRILPRRRARAAAVTDDLITTWGREAAAPVCIAFAWCF